jgi:alkanesulfonate monooxygenase SsuD/methylene tetrahydromethanopterin reductase-like flavin-dependent oxidoreductase (luciferase family)
MDFGVFFLGSSPNHEYQVEYEQALEQAVIAEELGFTTAWLAEHHGSDYGTFPSPAIFAAALAQRTKTIRIGVAASILPFQNPVRTAEDWAMIDVISGGRLSFAVGRGYQPREFKMMGADPTISREVFDEALQIVLGLWSTDGPFTFRGKHYTVEDVEVFPKPVQRPIPTWVAALSKPTFEMVAKRQLQIVTTPTLLPLEELKRNIVVAAQTLIAHGRAPEEIDFPMSMICHVADTHAEALANTDTAMDWQFSKLLGIAPGGGGKAAPASFEAYEEVIRSLGQAPATDSLIDAGIVMIGSPDELIVRLQALRDEVGLKHFICSFFLPGLSHEQVVASMELFAREVMPALAGPTPVPEAFRVPLAQAAG